MHSLYAEDTLKKSRSNVKLNIGARPLAVNNATSPVQVIVTPPVLSNSCVGSLGSGMGSGMGSGFQSRYLNIGRFSSVTSDASENFSDEFPMYTSSEFSEFSEAPVTPLSAHLAPSSSSLASSLDSLYAGGAATYSPSSTLPFPRLEMSFDSSAERIRIFLAEHRFKEVYHDKDRDGEPGAAVAKLKSFLELMPEQEV